jgi:opine dehydrogenase
MIKSIAVLGAGNGGFATAADLTRRGKEVRLWGRNPAKLDAIRARGGIAMKGVYEGFVPFTNVTTDVLEAVDGADLIMLTLPSSALAQCAASLAPALTPDRPVFINPGHTGGGLLFVAALRAAGYSKPVQTCETVTLTHMCRMIDATTVNVFSYGENLSFAAFPGRNVKHLYEMLAQVFPHIVPGANVFETAFMNINATFHPAGMLMNTGWIEHTGGNFLFYREGMSASVARVAEAVDRERMAIAKALGIPTMSFLEVFHRVGLTSKEGMESGSIRAACLASVPNTTVKSPPALAHRYIYEDVGYGLVPMTELARLGGVATPTMDALIVLANTALGEDLRKSGLTLDKMGIAGKKPSELSRYAELGE